MKDYCKCCVCKPTAGMLRCGMGWTSSSRIDDALSISSKSEFAQNRKMKSSSREPLYTGSTGDLADYELGAPFNHQTQPVEITLRHKEYKLSRAMTLPTRHMTLTRNPFPELSNSSVTPCVSPTVSHILMDTSARSTPSSSPPRYHSDHTATGFRSHPVSRSGSGYDISTGSRSISGYDLHSASKTLSPGQDNDMYIEDDEQTYLAVQKDDTEDKIANWTPSSYNKQLLFFYTDDDNYRPLVVDNCMTASDACHILVEKNHVKDDVNWVLIEHSAKLNMERLVEDHEVIHHIQRHWAEPEDIRLYFRKDFRKFEPFRNPSNFISCDMIDQVQLKDSNVCDLLPSVDRYNHILLQHLFNFDHLPDVLGYCFLKDNKKTWKKLFFVLKPLGLYYSSKGSSKESKHLVLLCQMNEVDIYVVNDAKKSYGTPHPHCLCLKRPNAGDVKDMMFLCVEDEKSLLCWYTVLRMLKFGSQLREDYRTAVNYVERMVLRDNGVLLSSDDIQLRARVAMDFTGTRGRVVDDPSEAFGVACEEASQWRKKVGVRKVTTFPGEADINRPSFLTNNNTIQQQYTQGLGAGIHMVLPWFHSGISRQEAVDLITRHGLVDGVFLVRESQSLSGIHVLSLAHNHKVKHCQIHNIEIDGNKYYTLDGGHTKFMDLVQLVEFYQLNAAGLPTRLTYYITCLV